MTSARILIVDDDERSRYTTMTLLRDPENHIDVAVSGVEALEKARQWHPDMILLDVMMPGIDGFEVCRRLRADPDIAEIRVFLLTALDDAASRVTGFEAGADDFITKPVNRQEVLACIRGITRLNRMRALIEQHRVLRSIQGSHPSQTSQPKLKNEELSEAFELALRSVCLAFQPIMLVGQQSEPVAYEVLVRTSEPRLSSASTFLAASVLLDRELELGQAIRSKVAQMIVSENLPIFINITAKDLVDEQLYQENYPLARYASQIVWEVTEREALGGVRNLRHRIKALRSKGYRFAVDDLGSGYASLNSIAVIEPDYVKLDRELVEGVVDSPTKQKIIQAIVALCRDLGINLIVEGVESSEVCTELCRLGCDLQQGFLFGTPMLRNGE